MAGRHLLLVEGLPWGAYYTVCPNRDRSFADLCTHDCRYW